MKNVFLFLTDKSTENIVSAFHQLATATRETGDAYILFHQKEELLPASITSNKHYVFSYDTLAALDYIAISEEMIPGSNHFPVMQFFQERGEYDYYWVIEDDVRFSGDWAIFFEAFKDADQDFLSSHLRTYEEEKHWFWWRAWGHPDHPIPREQYIRSFNPIYRLSRQGLSFIQRCLSDGWYGHHEVLIPTLLHLNQYKIADFGGTGQFVPDQHENRFYTPCIERWDGYISGESTMRYRPCWEQVGDLSNKLYHPVKPVS